MAGPSHNKKRSRDDAARPRAARPSKKQKKRQREYHSDSDSPEAGDEFQAVDLADSDVEDLDNIQVDDVASSVFGSDSDSDSHPSHARAAASKPSRKGDKDKSRSRTDPARDASPSIDGSDGEGESDDYDEDGYGDEGDTSGRATKSTTRTRHSKSKRNDPDAFATSLSKILSTKLSASRRADPVLARSAAAQDASRQAQDAALETKARRRLREQKRAAMEKGRVRDVLVAGGDGATADKDGGHEGDGGSGSVGSVGGAGGVGEPTTTAELMLTERRLRKVAQRGVVKLFNAVRTAQVKAAEAERAARSEGVTGVKRREEKVTEMSRKGFLDLIASGGGGLKKGGLEEA